MRKRNVYMETKGITCHIWNWNLLIVFLGWFFFFQNADLVFCIACPCQSFWKYVQTTCIYSYANLCSLELQNQSHLSLVCSFQARHFIVCLWPQWALYLYLLGTHAHRNLSRTVITIGWKRSTEKKKREKMNVVFLRQ